MKQRPYVRASYVALFVALLSLPTLSSCRFDDTSVINSHTRRPKRVTPNPPATVLVVPREGPGTPLPVPIITTVRCSLPSDCEMKEAPYCCLKADLIDETTKRLPDTLSEEEKGYCASSCQGGFGGDQTKKQIKLCSKTEEVTGCDADESCEYLNEEAPTPLGYCEKRCLSPEECGKEAPQCCLSTNLLIDGKHFPDTIPVDQRGYCAADCQAVSDLVPNPIKTCTQQTESAVCSPHTTKKICTYLNDAPEGGAKIGHCVKEDEIKCSTDQDCTQYCVVDKIVDVLGERMHVNKTHSYRGEAVGVCKSFLKPRDLCFLKGSKLKMPDRMDLKKMQEEMSATPYCLPSEFDRPQDETSGSNERASNGASHSPFGRVAYLCTNDDQCKRIDSSLTHCYGKMVGGIDHKPEGVGICQREPFACVVFDSRRGSCEDLTCCRAYGRHGNKDNPGFGVNWYCVDTTLSKGDCYPYDQYRYAGSYTALHHYGRCDNNQECLERFHAPFICRGDYGTSNFTCLKEE